MAAPDTQIPMPLGHTTHYSLDSYVVTDCNRSTLDLLRGWPQWPSFFLTLDGPRGSGKTHLARIWCEISGAAYGGPEILSHRDILQKGAPGLCIDGLAEGQFDPEALFHLINGVREAGAHLLITSRTPSVNWSVSLPDLQSRLRLASPVSLPAPDDELLRQVLVKLFSDRQLHVEKSAIDFVLVRMERSLSAAGDFVSRADRAALAESRPVNRRLAAQVLEDMARQAARQDQTAGGANE